jgi:hypothetical protein
MSVGYIQHGRYGKQGHQVLYEIYLRVYLLSKCGLKLVKQYVSSE